MEKKNFSSGQINIFGTFTCKESTGRLINAGRDHTRQQSGWLQNSFFSEGKNPSQHPAKAAAQRRRAYRSHSLQSKDVFIYIYVCISAIYQGCRTWSKPLVTHKNVRSQKNPLPNKSADRPAQRLCCEDKIAGWKWPKPFEGRKQSFPDGCSELSVGSIRIVSERH